MKFVLNFMYHYVAPCKKLYHKLNKFPFVQFVPQEFSDEYKAIVTVDTLSDFENILTICRKYADVVIESKLTNGMLNVLLFNGYYEG